MSDRGKLLVLVIAAGVKSQKFTVIRVRNLQVSESGICMPSLLTWLFEITIWNLWFIPGLHLEGPFLNEAKKGAHNQQYIRSFQNGFSDVSDVYGDFENVAMVTLAPELERSGEVIKELCDRGVKVSLGKYMLFCRISLKS